MTRSKRRMQVAQKRLKQGKDVLRRPIIFRDEYLYLWNWLINAGFDEWSWVNPSVKQVGLTGDLPGNRRLTKPLAVNVTWDCHEWLVSEPAYHMHTVGATIHKAFTCFRSLLCDYLDGLSEREGRPMSQHLQDQLAYLRDMIEDKTA